LPSIHARGSDAVADFAGTTSTFRVFAVRRTDGAPWLTMVGALGLLMAVGLLVFGLPPIDPHGPLHRVGIMDPLCGGSRSAYFTTHADFAEAWRYNPLGIVSVAAVVLVAGRAVIGFRTGHWLSPSARVPSRARWWGVAIAVVLLGMLEIRQQGRAELLMTLS